MNFFSKQLPYKKNFRLTSLVFFIIYIFMYVCISYLTYSFIYTNEFYFTSWRNQISVDRIAEFVNQQNKLAWVGYLFIPLFIFLKVLFPATSIYVYSLLYENDLKWKNCLTIAFQAEVILLIPVMLRLVWFIFIPPDSIETVSNFSPLSLSFLASDESPPYIKYLLQTINVFEILYWIALAVGIKSVLNINFKNCLAIVAKSYGIGLLMWLALVCFFLIQIS